MNRYFITGGTGFCGQAIVRNILKRDDTAELLLLTRGNRPLPHFFNSNDRVKYWKGDITDVAFPERDFTHLIHGACDANDLLQPDRHYYYYSIVEGARRIFEWAKRRGIPNTLFLSSGVAVYRDTVYGRAKRQSEFLAEHYHLPVRIARIFSVVGEGMPLNGQYAIGKFIWQAIEHGRINFWLGKSMRSYLHVDDCAEWCLKIMEYGQSWHPYDVGASRILTVRELAQLVGDVLNVPVFEIDNPDATPATNYIPRSSETQILLGLRETVTLEDAIRRCHSFYKESQCISQ